MQARLTSDFLWNQSPQAKAAAMVLLHPADGQLFLGQMIRFCVPSSFGMPTDISLGTLSADPLSPDSIVHDDNADPDGVSYYVACMPLRPEGRSATGPLAVTFGENGGKQLKTKQDVSVTRWAHAAAVVGHLTTFR